MLQERAIVASEWLADLVATERGMEAEGVPATAPFLRAVDGFTRCCGGGRLVSCKSAKDRTGMVVTLDLARQACMASAEETTRSWNLSSSADTPDRSAQGIAAARSREGRMGRGSRIASLDSAGSRSSGPAAQVVALGASHHGIGAAASQSDALPVNGWTLAPLELANVMRTVGTRLGNAYRNTGLMRFAFNDLQRSLMPIELRCPKGTGGGNIT